MNKEEIKEAVRLVDHGIVRQALSDNPYTSGDVNALMEIIYAGISKLGD